MLDSISDTLAAGPAELDDPDDPGGAPEAGGSAGGPVQASGGGTPSGPATLLWGGADAG